MGGGSDSHGPWGPEGPWGGGSDNHGPWGEGYCLGQGYSLCVLLPQIGRTHIISQLLRIFRYFKGLKGF